MGMRTIEHSGGRITTANPAAGRFQAPVFLRPPGSSGKSYGQLIDWRRTVRARSVRLIGALDEGLLNGMQFSHPLLGPHTLMEFAEFLGIHERHHLPQILRIRASLHVDDVILASGGGRDDV